MQKYEFKGKIHFLRCLREIAFVRSPQPDEFISDCYIDIKEKYIKYYYALFLKISYSLNFSEDIMIKVAN
jgi:hypothetical protein